MPVDVERTVRQVNCPACFAQAGNPCFIRPTLNPRDVSHPARYWQARIAGAISELRLAANRLIL